MIVNRLRSLGPGLVLAAAGIGAGDVVVASVTGLRFGTTLLCAVGLYNRREWIGSLANGWLGNVALVVCLVVFGIVCGSEVLRVLG